MPLAPLPVNNTDRAWLKYTSMGTNHEMVLRFPSVTTQANIITACTAVANGIKSQMLTTDSFIGLRHQDSGSTLSFPLAWTNIAGTLSFTPETDDEAKFVSIVGRSLNGYRCRITFFTPAPGDSANYRITTGFNLRTAITGLATPVCAVDGAAVVWNGYENIGYNSYWQRQLRG